jgi:pimeloyl-ACP methyl ester carboxylesterase
MLALGQAGIASAAYDMRGHGQSGRNVPEERYGVEQFIDDALAVRATLTQPPVLVGASMGGLVGLAAQSRGAGFAGLVLVDVTPKWEIAGMQRILAFMGAHPDGFEDHEHAASEIAAYLPHRRERKSSADLAHLLVRGDDGRLRWHWDPRLLQDLADSAKHQDELAEAARGIDVPVLLVSGGRSDLVSKETVAHFLELVPHAEHVHLPEATHMVAGDDNDAFTRAVTAFLSPRPHAGSFQTLRGA